MVVKGGMGAGTTLNRRAFFAVALSGILGGNACGSATAPDGTPLPALESATGTATPTALENLGLITALARRQHANARLYWVSGQANPLTGRAEGDQFWRYRYMFSGARGAGDVWRISSTGKIVFEGESEIPLAEGTRTDSILEGLRVDSDRIVQTARGAGFEVCARAPGEYISVNVQHSPDRFLDAPPLWRIVFDASAPGPDLHGGYIWLDASTGSVDTIVSACR